MTKEEIYDSQISPLVKQIRKISEEHNISLFMDFEIKTKTQYYCTTYHNFTDSKRISDCKNIAYGNGYYLPHVTFASAVIINKVQEQAENPN